MISLRFRACRCCGAGGAGAEHAAELCPVCQEALAAELAMLPCGHPLCVRCQMALIDRLPGNLPRARSPSSEQQLCGMLCAVHAAHVRLRCKAPAARL